MPARGGDRSLFTRLRWSAYVARRAPFESRFPFASPERIRAAQLRRLRATVAHAREHVPYYREELRRAGIDADGISGPQDLSRLPIVDRDMLAADPERFRSQAEPAGQMVELRSGGSTGDPITFFVHPFSLFEQAVYTERRRTITSNLAGRRRYREARVSDIPTAHAGGEHVSRSFRGLSLLPSSIRFKRRQYSVITPLDRLLAELDDYSPDVLASFGSFQEMYLTELVAGRRPDRLPKVMVYAGDGMTEPARRLARERFGIRTLSVYTATEAFQIGFECERHRGHHLNCDLFPVRVIGPDGDELPAGEPGDVIVSNLQARGTILLNYRLNDVAAKLDDRCPCGRNLPLLSLVQGRSDEWLEGGDGRRLHSHAVRIFFHDELEVIRFQVAQLAPDLFRAALATVDGAGHEGIRRRLERRFTDAFGPRTRLELSFVDELPRSPAGKARPVVAMSALDRTRRAGALEASLDSEPG